MSGPRSSTDAAHNVADGQATATGPACLARAVVGLAVLALPTPASRERYRQEFRAELCGLPRGRQLREAMSMLGHCGVLRSAVTPTDPVELVATQPGRKPLLCYLHHRLRPFVTAEGVLYRRCIRCGEDHYDGKGDNNLTGNLIGSVIAPQNN